MNGIAYLGYLSVKSPSNFIGSWQDLLVVIGPILFALWTCAFARHWVFNWKRYL